MVASRYNAFGMGKMREIASFFSPDRRMEYLQRFSAIATKTYSFI